MNREEIEKRMDELARMYAFRIIGGKAFVRKTLERTKDDKREINNSLVAILLATTFLVRGSPAQNGLDAPIFRSPHMDI